MGYHAHLANPHGNDWGHGRGKNDERDARDLADLLRLGRLAYWLTEPMPPNVGESSPPLSHSIIETLG